MEVRVVRRADDDRVELAAHRVKQLAIVGEAARLGMVFERTRRSRFINVRKANQVLALDAADVRRPTATDANTGDVQFFVGALRRRDTTLCGPVIEGHSSSEGGLEGTAASDRLSHVRTEWESGRVGEWESGRVGEWESGRVCDCS